MRRNPRTTGVCRRVMLRPGDGDEEYAVLGIESGPVTITYKNSNGDNTTISITIDKEAPTIQVDAPINKTASKDDSPELLGSFTDGGGSGLREESFKIYADNTPDGKEDNTPVWDLRVNNNVQTAVCGQPCRSTRLSVCRR